MIIFSRNLQTLASPLLFQPIFPTFFFLSLINVPPIRFSTHHNLSTAPAAVLSSEDPLGDPVGAHSPLHRRTAPANPAAVGRRIVLGAGHRIVPGADRRIVPGAEGCERSGRKGQSTGP